MDGVVAVLVLKMDIFGIRVASMFSHIIYLITVCSLYFRHEKPFLEQLGYKELDEGSKKDFEVTERQMHDRAN